MEWEDICEQIGTKCFGGNHLPVHINHHRFVAESVSLYRRAGNRNCR